MASDTAETIVSVLATIATVCIFLSMVPGIWAAHKKKSMVGINYYPLAMMYAQSAGWAIYSWADDSFFPVGAVNCLGVLLGAIFSGVYDDDIAKVLGYCADVLAIIMFGSPLLQLGEVVKTRNSEVIAAPMAISGAINGVFWSIYGIMVTDYYVIVPNVISGCLCFVQVFLIVVFPRKSEDDKSLKFLENRSVSEV
ncbi:uncharacterized protein PITG_04981 [Phytophthora infestans T30-4]|uniref:Sugar transporter SWEET1 n=1 Tax=Phytophthora infestans (strain T30-4) TaxID=403677 RepID=D0N2I0_PHYIT|nr:uncharacterized protein PITG_04981 [Phytophthora infestans T30-4]EEY68509.1 conserved hypothetical protein [Phytophthora infestans T30-4]|eukprot:XP_002905668.1 conserved hypothetical protein [Phytophthora infestans T30-4]